MAGEEVRANGQNGQSGKNGEAPGKTATHVANGVLRGRSPLDGAELAPLAVSTPAEIRHQVERARVAQASWAELTVDERFARMQRAAREMLQRRHEVMALARREMGKLEVEGLFHEALGPLETLGRWHQVVREATGRKRVRLNPMSFPGKRASVDLLPRGVVGIIAPWNFPVSGLYRSVFPALLTGNAVVLKPSEHTPRASAWLVERLATHLPEGLVSVAFGDGAAGAALVEAGIDACVFTGSPAAGAKVRVRCAELGLPASVELGGKDPAIVLCDCDLPRTVAGLTHWSLSNVGQSCGAIELALVDRAIADELVSALASAWQRLRTWGAAPDQPGQLEIAPLANERQLAVVEAQVADALAKGAKLVTGGARTGLGLGYLPTLLDHCDERMAVVREETFGPVLAVVRVDGPADAIRRANELPYGLGASLWTRDLARAERLADRLAYGVVDVNNHGLTGAMPELPWSGLRKTGFGVANGEHGLSTFVRPRALLVDTQRGPEMFWMPFDRELLELGELLSDAQLGRILGAWKIPLLLRRRVETVKRFFGMP
jgi:acyl-CoA reductase-like NAD-dependent aldehyde dehydrogenase